MQPKPNYTKYRLVISSTALPDWSDNGHKVALSQWSTDPETGKSDWRQIVNYCYGDPVLALDEMREMIKTYESCGIPVEHNLDKVHIEEPIPLPPAPEVAHA